MYDIVLRNGLIVIDTSDDDHIEDMLLLAKGGNKFSPHLGVNVNQYIHSKGNGLENDIARNLEADGAKNITIDINPQTNQIEIDATY
ncbi:MAG: hypothetical protein K2Q03_05710 [Sphingobacteriaceae bacterium]|nr:hypothetical protein [Sphingobacteriaceae bacterium]